MLKFKRVESGDYVADLKNIPLHSSKEIAESIRIRIGKSESMKNTWYVDISYVVDLGEYGISCRDLDLGGCFGYSRKKDAINVALFELRENFQI